MPIDINAPEQAMCESLDALDSNVLVVSDNEDGSLDFSCSATSGLAQTISIDCGNGQVFTDYDVESLSVSCDYVGNGEEQIYAVVCEVNGETADDCQQPAIVTPPFLDYCGDGIMRGYEQCDLGDGAVPIDEYLDVEGNVDAGKYGGGNYYCENCAIKTHGVTAYQPPACFNVNTNISVMEDELLPFYWTLDMNQAETDHDAGAEEGDSCDEVGAINLDTMMCTFALYNGDNYNQADRRDLDTFTLPCDTDEWDGDQLFEYFEDRNDEDSDFYYSLDYDPIGKYVIKIGKNVKVDGKTITTFDDDTFGEHKLVLERVSYDYCREVYDEESGDVSRKWDRGVYLDRVCEVNYVVTKPYLIQKSAFGATKVDDDLDLRDFYDIFGDKIVSKTDLEDVMDLEAEDLDGGVEIEALLDIFEDKYSKVAVDIPQEQRGDLVSEYQDLEKVSKVPGKNIFVFEGDGKMVMSQETGKYPATSYTIIVKGMDLYIEGSVTTNGMFIVDGNIGFQEKDATLFCQAPQEVQGIFIARDGFVGTEYSENEDGYVGRFDKNNRLCEYGNLIVK